MTEPTTQAGRALLDATQALAEALREHDHERPGAWQESVNPEFHIRRDHLFYWLSSACGQGILAALAADGWSLVRSTSSGQGDGEALAALLRFTVCDVCMSTFWGTAWCHDRQTSTINP